MDPVIPDKDVELTGQYRWQKLGPVDEPRRFENWKSQAVVYGVFAAVAIGTVVLLVAFLSEWPK